MTADFRRLWLHLKGSYWFIPTVLTLLALALSSFTIYLDVIGAGWWFEGTGWLETSGVEGARAFLTVIASAMIAIASTVFAITIAAVAYASGNYGPRLLTNFMNDRGNQVSLGVFIATFVYGLLVLRVVDGGGNEAGTAGTDIFIPQLSLFVASLMVIYAVAQLVYFLHHIPASIRINTVLAGIGRRLLEDIEERFPEGYGSREPEQGAPGAPIFLSESGYIEIIDFASLQEIACDHDVAIRLRIRTGDFAHPGLAVADVRDSIPNDELIGKIRDAFAIGSTRTRAQDLEYLIDELVEIALRALSPGINDPFTAVSCIHWMGAALASLAARDLCRGPEQGNYDLERVRPLPDDFQHYLGRSFGAVRASAAASPIAARLFLESLTHVGTSAASTARRGKVVAEGRLLAEQAVVALDGPALAEVQERLCRFEKDMRESPE